MRKVEQEAGRVQYAEGGSAVENLATGYQVARALGGDYTGASSLLVKAGKKIQENKYEY